MRAETANALLLEVKPLAQRVCDGYDERWDGSNTVGVFNDDATEASEAIEALCDGPESDLCVWEASDWFASFSDEDLARDLGITAKTTDDELKNIAFREEQAASDSDGCDGVEGVVEYLTKIRDWLVEEAS